MAIVLISAGEGPGEQIHIFMWWECENMLKFCQLFFKEINKKANLSCVSLNNTFYQYLKRRKGIGQLKNEFQTC